MSQGSSFHPRHRELLRGLALAGAACAAAVWPVALPGDARASHRTVAVEREVPYTGRAGGPKLDVHRPWEGAAGRPAVLVIHGGGWIARDKSNVEPIAEALAHAGFVAFNANFTLSRFRRPAFRRQPSELRTAVKFIRANAGGYGVDPSRIGAYGSSSGAHLAAQLATVGKGSLTSGYRIRAAVAWGGSYRLRGVRRPQRLRRRIAAFLGCRRCPARAASASPVRHVSRDDPAIMLVHSRRETIPLNQPRSMLRRLRRKRVPRNYLVLPGKAHLPIKAPRAFRKTIGFLNRRLG